MRQKRETCRETANILKTTLEEVGVEDFDRLQDLESQCHDRLRLVDKEIQMSRSKLEIQQTHVTDSLRKEARSISEELRALEISIDQIIEIQDDDKRHLNEMLGLAVKVQKMHVANEILRNISFVRCPCCNQSLRQSPSDGDRCRMPFKTHYFVFSDIVLYGTTSSTKGVVYETPQDKTWEKSCLAP